MTEEAPPVSELQDLLKRTRGEMFAVVYSLTLTQTVQIRVLDYLMAAAPGDPALEAAFADWKAASSALKLIADAHSREHRPDETNG